MQRAMDQVSQTSDNYDLTISTITKVVHQPAPGKPHNEPTITVNGQKLKVVDKFTYLGSTFFPEQCTLMVRSLPEMQKPVWYSEDSVQMSGSEMESSLTPSSQGGQKKRFKDTLKASLKDFDILTGSWEQRYQRNEVSSTKEQPSMKKENL